MDILTVNVFLTLVHLVQFYPPVTMEPLVYCLNYVTDMCISCDYNDYYCDEISSEAKMIQINRNASVDYEKYVHTNVKIIQEYRLNTYYSCPNMFDKYLQVYSYNYYPITNQLNFSSIVSRSPPIFHWGHISVILQNCLETFCSTDQNHIFICHGLSFTNLQFVFNDIVTPYCLQNITTTCIISKTMLDVDRSLYFFTNAYNMIYLMLDVKDLKNLRCNRFQKLVNLRELELVFPADTDFDPENYKCIFRYNPNLVKIVMNDKWLWNECITYDTVDYSVNYPLITTFFVIIVIIGSFGVFFLYHQYMQVRISISNDGSKDMCHVYSENRF